MVDAAKAPTCTESGLTEGKHCGVCDFVITAQETVPAKGHTPVTDPAKAPTCTEAGLTEGKHCGVCNATLTAQETVPAKGHTPVTDPAKAPTCTESGLTEGSHCGVCDAVITAQETIPAKGHTPVTDPAKAPTCTESGLTEGSHCGVCYFVITAQESVPTLGESGHVVVTDAAILARGDRDGRTEGSHCSACGKVFVAQTVIPAPGYTDPALYQQDYAYRYLGTLEKGAALQSFYLRLDELAKTFHTDVTFDASAENYVGHFGYADLGLSIDEAVSVWICYRNEHPLYYWISNSYATTSSDFYLLCTPEYAKGSDRAACTAELLAAIKALVDPLLDETDPYRLALAFHDAILLGADYAYEADGVTPESEAWAHSAVGVLLRGSGVCESYAKAFQLLLSYCEVENILVTGVAQGAYAWENHAWSLVELSEDEWYWFDLTWDDQPAYIGGITYTYFCVTDDTDVRRLDGNAGQYTQATFLQTHVFSTPESGPSYLYPLPARATSAYASEEELTLRETFSQDGLTYALVGPDRVQLVRAEVNGLLAIPETVTHNGRTYTVVAIGAMDAEGYFGTWESVIPAGYSVTAITLPKTLHVLWDNALGSPDGALTSVTVDAANPFFDSLDGVLFTEGLHTLLLYPNARASTSYVIPDETVFIASYAFTQSASNRLTSLTLGASLREAGVCAGLGGYPQMGATAHGFLRTGEWSLVYYSLTGAQSLSVSAENTHLSIKGGLLYAEGGTRVLGRVDRRITEVVLGSDVQSVDPLAFYGCPFLKTVYYEGDAASYAAITVGYQNDELTSATVLFYSESAAAGCWHYVGGQPTPW